MCLWKMTPSVNRKFGLFAIFFQKNRINIVNLLILFNFYNYFSCGVFGPKRKKEFGRVHDRFGALFDLLKREKRLSGGTVREADVFTTEHPLSTQGGRRELGRKGLLFPMGR